MLSRLLTVTTALHWLLASALGYGFAQLWPAWWVPVLTVAVVLIGTHGLLLAVEFTTGALIDHRAGRRLGPWAAIRLWWQETWTSWRMFDIHMPFFANFAEPPLQPDPSRPAVLLIHGFACNRAVWKPLLDSGLLAGCNVATINLEPVWGAIDTYGPVIRDAVHRLRTASGAARVTLVCHSMGGLAARVYLRDFGADAVKRVVTVATPHAGTVFAKFGYSLNTRQMRRGSDFLRELGLATAPMAGHFVCIGSRDDNLIVPRASVWLPGAQHLTVERVGHLAMLGSARVQRLITDAIHGPETPTRG